MRKKLRQFMAEKNMSQDRLAELLGTNKFTLSRWMNGKSKPSPAYMQIIKAAIQ